MTRTRKLGGQLHRHGLAVPVLAALLVIAVTAMAVANTDRSSSPTRAPSCLGKHATIIGSPNDRVIVGTPGRDVIVGTGGSDYIRGRGGADLICGGGGNDVLEGGPGKDSLAGGSGDDYLNGGADRDRCTGGSGSDTYSQCEMQPNRPPIANRLSAATGEDQPTSIDVIAGAFDPDSDPLTVASVETSATIGQVDIVGARTVRFDPAHRFDHLGSGQSATTSFGFTVDDGHGGSASSTVTITIEGSDDPPTALADSATVAEDEGAAPIDVLANDTDIDGGPKQIESTSQPAHGTVAITGNGSGLTYEPEANYCNDGEAADSFTYTLNGGSSATVSVAVECVTTFSTDEGLEPEFDPAVSDYTVRCDGAPLEASGRLSQGASIEVDGGAQQTGKFEATVPLGENQEFSFSVAEGGTSHSYFVRCLPSNFPAWEYEQLREPDSKFYVVAPTLGPGAQQYAVVFDRNGVPVWWDTEAPGRIIDATVLGDGTLAWWRDNHGFLVHSLDGTVLREIVAVTGPTDLHELQEEPNGNFLLITSAVREHIDLTEFGYGPDESVHDYVIEELDPQGHLVWRWDTANHIGLNETGRWWPRLASEEPRDIVHMNAVEPDGEGAVLVSLRHTDAVYKIDKATGEVVWKLGGTWTPKRLTVVNDPQGNYPLGGQHDVRLMPGGTITIHDNNTELPQPPRAVRYKIDEANHTATLVEELTDPLVRSSSCCGSARRSADGSWLMSWGGDSLVAEYDPLGQPNFRLGFGGTVFSYRAVAAPEGTLDISSLRAGMDSMHPR